MLMQMRTVNFPQVVLVTFLVTRKTIELMVSLFHREYVRMNHRWFRSRGILVPRGRAPFGQHQEWRPLARSNDIPVLNETKTNQICQTGLWAYAEWREVRESRTCGVGPGQRGQRLRFLVLTKRSAASEDENARMATQLSAWTTSRMRKVGSRRSSSSISNFVNLVPRAHVSFGQHQDMKLWNNHQAPELSCLLVLKFDTAVLSKWSFDFPSLPVCIEYLCGTHPHRLHLWTPTHACAVKPEVWKILVSGNWFPRALQRSNDWALAWARAWFTHFRSLSLFTHKIPTVNLRHSSHLGTKFNHSAPKNVLFTSFTA